MLRAMRLSRRRLVIGSLGVGAVGLVGARMALAHLWRASGPRPVADRAREFADERLRGLDLARVWDAHVHLVGLGPDSGCWVHPSWREPLHPIRRLQFDAYLAAAGVDDGPRTDRDYVERLLALQRAANATSRLVLLGFDYRYTAEGRRDVERSAFYVPDAYLFETCEEFPDAFAPCPSIHPFAPGALERLDAAAERGACAVKWIPAAQGIDPLDPGCDAFYERLASHGLPLLAHSGAERSMDVHGDDELGNPLRLRRALDHGVRVIVAHCASLGSNDDLDEPEHARAVRPSWELFVRMLGEERYRDTLFGDLSALPFVHRSGAPLEAVLARPELRERLVFSSDYPLIGVPVLTMLGDLVRRGYLDRDEAELLEELRRANLLLFDLVLKRTIHANTGDDRGARLPDAVFHTRDRLRAV